MAPRLLIGAILATAASATVHAQAAPKPSLIAVLARAAAYVEEFREQLSGLVAEETYIQQESSGRRRELRSDLLLVRSEAFPHWLQFRDTFEVDGRPVRDRGDRLTALFRQPAATAAAQAQRIAMESSRFNLGPVARTINVPLMPLVFLEPDTQKRFRFSRASDTDRPALPHDEPGYFRVTTEVWVVRFEERKRPTIIRDHLSRRNVPSEGRFWIEPHSGRVLMSEMRSTHPDVRVEISVSYQSQPFAGLLVPVAMHETYRNARPTADDPAGTPWETITASAVYGRFRQITRTPNRGPGTRNPEPGTGNPEPGTLNAEPNPEPLVRTQNRTRNTNREP
jgi:hypothetical protein